MTENQLREIFDKTEGHCHFCGDPIIFHLRGFDPKYRRGYWEVDHVIQQGKGGKSSAANYLPTCTRCNRLRWHRRGKEIRELLFLGILARNEISKESKVGKVLAQRKRQRLEDNMGRRKLRNQIGKLRI